MSPPPHQDQADRLREGFLMNSVQRSEQINIINDLLSNQSGRLVPLLSTAPTDPFRSWTRCDPDLIRGESREPRSPSSQVPVEDTGHPEQDR